MIDIGKSIKLALAKNGYSQYWLSRKIGVSPASVSQYANKTHASTRSLVPIANALDMSVSDLIRLGEE